MSSDLTMSLVTNLEILKELPASEMTMQIRSDNVTIQLTISVLDKGMSSLFLIEIPKILFTSFPDGKKSSAIKNVISALKRKKQIPPSPLNYITSSLLITPNALIIRSEISVPDSCNKGKHIHKISKIDYEETTLLKASHPPIEDYPIQFLLGDEQFKTILRSLSLPQITDVLFEIGKESGISLKTTRKDLPSSARITLLPSSTTTLSINDGSPLRMLDVFHCEQDSKISLNIRDLSTLSKFSISLSTSIVFYVSKIDEPIVIKLLPVGRESITCVCTSLGLTEMMEEGGIIKQYNDSRSSSQRDSNIISESDTEEGEECL